jgi:hypothetical protein
MSAVQYQRKMHQAVDLSHPKPHLARMELELTIFARLILRGNSG